MTLAIAVAAGVGVFGAVATLWSACAAAGRADREADAWARKWRERGAGGVSEHEGMMTRREVLEALCSAQYSAHHFTERDMRPACAMHRLGEWQAYANVVGASDLAAAHELALMMNEERGADE